MEAAALTLDSAVENLVLCPVVTALQRQTDPVNHV